MSKEQSNQLSALLQWDPQHVHEWTKGVWKGEVDVDTAKFNWLGLAQGAASKTFPSNESRPNLEWACVAVDVYEYLANSLAQDSDTFKNSAMLLRARLISILGDHADEPLLDITSIATWFYESLPMSRQAALDLIEPGLGHLLAANVEGVRKLRGIKNRIAVVELLRKHGHFENEEEINEWINLKDKLP